MTALPFPLVVLHALTDALEQIAPANGFQFDMTPADRGDGVLQKRVFRGRAWFGDNDPIPMISVLEGRGESDEIVQVPENATVGAYDWPIVVQGFVMDDPENPTDPARKLLADVRQRLAQEATRKLNRSPDPLGLGRPDDGKVGRVISLHVGFGGAHPADDISAKAYFVLPIVIRVVDHADAPYA